MPCMDFNIGRPSGFCGLQLPEIGDDEQRNTHPGICQKHAGVLDAPEMLEHIETAFCGELEASFRNQAGMLWAYALCKLQHLPGGRQFKIHRNMQFPAQHYDIFVLNVPAVFTQVQRNGVGPCFFRKQRRLDRIGISGPTRLPQRGNVIDVNTQPYHFFLGKS